MSVATSIRTKLLATAAVTAIVSQRVYAIAAPDGVSGPHVIVDMVASQPAQVHSGASGISHRLFQFTCFGRTYEQVEQLREEIITALDGVTLDNGDIPTLEDERDAGFEDGVNLYRADVDFFV